MELEGRLRQETDDFEERMREDVELAIARRRDELRVEIERNSKRVMPNDSQNVNHVYGKSMILLSPKQLMTSLVHSNLMLKQNLKFVWMKNSPSYRNAREAEIQNRLARFRYEREAELREQLEGQYDSKKVDWSERLELEFQSREASARKAIMSEVDAGSA